MNNALHDPFDFLVIEIITVDPSTSRIFISNLNLGFSYCHAGFSIQGIISYAADDNVHIGTTQVAAQFRDQTF